MNFLLKTITKIAKNFSLIGKKQDKFYKKKKKIFFYLKMK